MAEATLPLPARVHAAVARALEWVWPRGAAWAYADAIAHVPRHAELHFLRGQALARARCFPQAARSLAEAARLRPSSVEYQGALVVALDRAGHEQGVVEALRRFAELRPGEGEVQVLIGAVLRRSGRHAEALRAFRLAVRLGSLPRTRRFVLGEALLGAEGWQAALAGWNEARQIESASGSVILRNAGRRSSLNFHPGQPMFRVPKREPPPPQGPLAWVREHRKVVRAALLALLRREWGGKGDRVRAIRKAWRKAHPGVAPRKPSPPPLRPVAGPARGAGRGHVVVVVLALAAAGAAAAERGAPAGETTAAREQARLCERENLEAGAAACREALALGIGGARRAAVRERLARHLVALERWDELAELLRENVRLEPASSAAWQRLGLTLLFGLGETAEAVGALEEAVRLGPADASARLGLALALQAAGRAAEAVEARDQALRLDPAVLEGRPAARAALEAARRGEPWP
ncbi:MAG TPA: BTAD domain-containing putative transcriptional regulator [Vicinamibacteria bacterium]|nr:BTAD domain-containing putative transcriptional regulator [Vicinamibacteria bacterium]